MVSALDKMLGTAESCSAEESRAVKKPFVVLVEEDVVTAEMVKSEGRAGRGRGLPKTSSSGCSSTEESIEESPTAVWYASEPAETSLALEVARVLFFLGLFVDFVGEEGPVGVDERTLDDSEDVFAGISRPLRFGGMVDESKQGHNKRRHPGRLAGTAMTLGLLDRLVQNIHVQPASTLILATSLVESGSRLRIELIAQPNIYYGCFLSLSDLMHELKSQWKRASGERDFEKVAIEMLHQTIHTGNLNVSDWADGSHSCTVCHRITVHKCFLAKYRPHSFTSCRPLPRVCQTSRSC